MTSTSRRFLKITFLHFTLVLNTSFALWVLSAVSVFKMCFYGLCPDWFNLSGNRYIKIAKSPMSATIAFHYEITAAGIEQIGDETFDASDGGRNMIQWLVPYPLRFVI